MKSRWLVWTWMVVIAVTLAGSELNPHAAAIAGEPWDAAEMDWPHWRGPEMNGISREKNLPDTWSPDGDNLIWQSSELASRSTPVIMDGRLFTLVRDQPGTKREGEKVVCVDAATGKKLWENRFNVFLSDVPDTRVGWSAVVADPESNKVFALGVCGYFQCLDPKTGETLWSHSLSEEYGVLSTYGGRTNFPITYKNLVIISGVVIGWGDMAKPAHRFLAFDQRNGQPVWFTSTELLPEDTTYSSPVLTAFNGEAALVFAAGDGAVYCFQPETGKEVWKYKASARGINTTPVIAGNKVICGHSEENLDVRDMGALFCFDGTQTGQITNSNLIWRNTEWFVGKSSPIVVDGRVYACEDSGSLIVADLETGKLITRERLGGQMRSSPIYADGKIYLLTENGRWWVFKLTEDGVEAVARERMRIGDSYGSPIVSHGRMYIPTTEGLYCIGLKDATPAADPRPEPPAITPVDEDETPAQAAIVPVESLLKPGQKQPLQVWLYNQRGQFLKVADAEKPQFSVKGAGSVDGNTFTTPKETGTAAAHITAKIGDLTATARARIIPPLPLEYTFDNGTVPEPWVGMRYRHIPIDFDLAQRLKGESQLAVDLYFALTTAFVNSGQSVAKYDDSTARKAWTDLTRYLKVQANSLEEAQETLNPVLELLKEEELVSDWKWDRWSREVDGNKLGGVVLTVNRGPRQVEGNGVMMKISTIPKGTRSQGWIGPVDLSDYTIQADVYAATRDNNMPDMGIIAQRYTLDLMGAHQQVQIRTWPPQLRMAKTVPFAWKGNTWYTIKLRASVEDGQAVLRGKVWPRDEEEPKDWTLSATDESPNVIGSPGFFGNANESEVMYDNIKIYNNRDS